MIRVTSIHMLLAKTSHLAMPNSKGDREVHFCNVSERERERQKHLVIALMIATLAFLRISSVGLCGGRIVVCSSRQDLNLFLPVHWGTTSQKPLSIHGQKFFLNDSVVNGNIPYSAVVMGGD